MAQRKIAEILAEVYDAQATGILTFSLNNDTSLFKIFFRKGRAYHITHSTCKDSECLVKANTLQFKVGMFMPGALMDRQDGSPMPEIPKQDILAALGRISGTVEWAGQWSGRSTTPVQVSASTVDEQLVASLGEELLNLAGPVGPLVLEAAYTACKLRQGQPLSVAEFKTLIQTISGKLPAEQGREFSRRFASA